MKKFLLILPILLLSVLGCRKDLQYEHVEQTKAVKSFSPEKDEVNKKKQKYEQGMLLIEWRNGGVNTRSIGSVHGRMMNHIQTPLMRRHGKNGFYKIKVDNVDSALALLKKDPDVLKVSPNYVDTTFQTGYPNDPYFTNGSLWGIQRVNAPTAWAQGNKGNMSIVVGIVDQGIFAHSDLCHHMWTNPREIPGNGIDDDNNGYVDDINGWNWFDNSNIIFTGGDFHATHVMGTICGEGNNGIGIIGVAPYATAIALKFIGNDGYGYNDAAIQALDYATYQKEVFGENIVATNNSWGGSGYDPFLKDAIDRQGVANIVTVCAAGNSAGNSDVDPLYPGGFSTPTNNVLTCAASDEQNGLAYFSNYGATTVDIAAPGVNIWSCAYTSDFHDSYAVHGGTSMATPHVTGGVVLYCAGHPGASYSQIKAAIVASATPSPALQGKCRANGYLNVSGFAFQTPASQPSLTCPIQTYDVTPPTTPTNLTVVSNGFASTTLKWNASSDPESAIKEYWVFVGYPDLSNQWITTDTFLTVTNLTVSPVNFAVQAVNDFGKVSDFSNVVQGNPILDKEPPTSPVPASVTAVDSTDIVTQWSASTDNSGSIAKYRVKWFVHGQTNGFYVDLAYGYLSYQISNLLPATDYDVYISAFDGSGNESVPYTQTVKTPGVGGGGGGGGSDITPPTPTTIIASNPTVSSFHLDWAVFPDDVGTVSYTVYYRQVGTVNYSTVVTTANSADVIGLTQATTYEAFVKGKDAAGNISAASNTVQVTTLEAGDAIPPTAPSNPVFSNPTLSSLTFSYSASTDNVGVTGYIVYWRQFGQTIWNPINTTSLFVTIPGLQAGTTYEAYAVAKDAAGNISQPSPLAQGTTLSNSPVDTEAPSIPTNVNGYSQNWHQVNLSWTASTDNVGVVLYKIFRNGSQVGTSTTTSFIDNNPQQLQGNTTYTYTVKAADAAGNESGFSTPIQVTTKKKGKN